MAKKLSQAQYYKIDGQLTEIKRQMRQENGYPFNPTHLVKHLQDAIDGKFTEPPRSWREQDGVIYFSVTSDGTTGEAWIKRLKMSDYAKSVLRSSDFKPTDGMTTEVAVLKGMLFEDRNRITKKICVEADKHKLSKPNAEVACLICEKFTNEEIEAMGLWWIVVMHDPIKDSDGDPDLLGVDRRAGGRWLGAYHGYLGLGWDREDGFAFAVSQVS